VPLIQVPRMLYFVGPVHIHGRCWREIIRWPNKVSHIPNRWSLRSSMSTLKHG
jgi:hypothetical protein